MNHFAGLGLAMTLAVTLAGGCSRSGSDPNVAFETQPRPVLESIGLVAPRDPELAVDTSATLYVFAVYDENSKPRLGLVQSHDGGDTFSSPVLPISEPNVSIGSEGEQSPSVAMTRSEIYALWQESAADGSGRIMLSRSLSWGESFEKPVQVSDPNVPSYKSFPSVSVAPNGDVYAVWLDERDNSKPGGESSSVYIAKSTDRGATFGLNVKVGSQACPCCRPSVAFGPNREILVGWRRVFPGEIRDVVVSSSRDTGRTFSDPIRVNEDGWKLNGCPDSGPALAESGGVLSVVWMTEGKDEHPRLQLARSMDAANSFSRPMDVSRNVLDPNHPVLKTADDGTIWLIFQGRAPTTDGNWNQTQAYLIQISREGKPSLPTPVPSSSNSISYPTLGIGSGGRIYLAWTQPQANRKTAMLLRARTKP